MNLLVSGLVDGLSDQACAALVARAEGIPLYAVETVRTLIDREIVRPENGRYVVAPGAVVDLADVAAPPSLHALVASRLDALTAQERRVVADASVLGLTFPREGIEFLCRDVANLDDALASLQRKELLGVDNDRFSAERGQLRFVQAVVRQVAYSTLSRRARKERHLAVASHLQVTNEGQGDLSMVSAQHLIDAIEAAGAEDPDVPELNTRAAALLVLAGQRAAGLGALASAVSAFRQAAELMTDPLESAGALLLAAKSAEEMFDAGTALELARVAHDIFSAHGVVVEASRAASLVARASTGLGEAAEGLRFARGAWDSLVNVVGAEDVQARLAITIAQATNNLDGDPKDVVWYGAEALRLSEACGDPVIIIAAMRYHALFQFARGSSRTSSAVIREVIELARAGGHWPQLITALVNQSLTARLRSLPEGLALARECSSTARQHGMKVWQVECNLTTMLWMSGQREEHDALLTRVSEEWDSVPGPDQILFYASDLWRISSGLAPILSASTGTFDELNWRSWDCHVRALRTAAAGDRAAALLLARECLELSLTDAGLTDDYPMQMPRMVWLALEADDREFVRWVLAHLASAPKGLEIAGLRAYEQTFSGLLDLREGRDIEAAEGRARLGASGLQTYGAVPDRALAQEELGRWLVEHGRGLDAGPLLEAARTTYTELGASAWLARLEQLTQVN